MLCDPFLRLFKRLFIRLFHLHHDQGHDLDHDLDHDLERDFDHDETFSLLLDYTVRNNMSDKWDSSIMDGGQGSDRFSLFSLGVAYDLKIIR